MQLLFSVAALSALSRATAFVPSVSVGVSSSRSRLSMVAIEPSSALTTPASRDVLADAFGNLSESDQYDAVLTGLCSKLLEDCADGSATTVDASSMSGPLDLLEEMHARDIPVSGRSLSALVDTAAASKSARVLETSLRSLRRVLRPADDAPPAPSPSFWNASPPSSPARRAALERYGGAAAAYLPLLPSDARARVRALEATDPLPADDRAGEMAAALTAAVAVAACVAADAVDQMAWGVELWQPDLALGCLAATAALDTGYGALQKSSRLVRAVPDLPENEMLGTGKITGKVWKGMRRLFNTDTERECQCEAAAFYAAYVLGLPCFAFRPNALEAAVLVYETRSDPAASLLTRAGVLRVLVWLLAPVAHERQVAPPVDGGAALLVASDPREARGLLRKLAEKAADMGAEEEWAALEMEGEGGEEALRWAYDCADRLVRENARSVEELSRCLAGGAATVGDLVAVVEEW